jgi:hypothetical protein
MTNACLAPTTTSHERPRASDEARRIPSRRLARTGMSAASFMATLSTAGRESATSDLRAHAVLFAMAIRIASAGADNARDGIARARAAGALARAFGEHFEGCR